ncbi:MAG: tRNA (5-methylaminomethyl-2-thiouridine)(34)-methyltransferase MnmD [Mucinivorans sp.]
MKNPEIIATDDGSSTLVSAEFEGELYHSSRGAVGEARHIFIRFLRPDVRVFEVGLGSGLNALLSLESGLKIDYSAVELYPITSDVASRLSFACAELIAIHNAPWGEKVQITPQFSIYKIKGDLVSLTAEQIAARGAIDLVFFDAFAPDVVPEMWSEAVLTKIYEAMAPGGQLLTYSAKGSVKRALGAAGFTIERLEGALGKRHMLRATKATI